MIDKCQSNSKCNLCLDTSVAAGESASAVDDVNAVVGSVGFETGVLEEGNWWQEKVDAAMGVAEERAPQRHFYEGDWWRCRQLWPAGAESISKTAVPA
jgi:hypothetical protein